MISIKRLVESMHEFVRFSPYLIHSSTIFPDLPVIPICLTGTNTRDGDPARNAAKNALTTNAHALMYQYRTAIKFNRDIFAGLDETTVKRPRMSLEDGQRLLSF